MAHNPHLDRGVDPVDCPPLDEMIRISECIPDFFLVMGAGVIDEDHASIEVHASCESPEEGYAYPLVFERGRMVFYHPEPYLRYTCQNGVVVDKHRLVLENDAVTYVEVD